MTSGTIVPFSSYSAPWLQPNNARTSLAGRLLD
jgi:hypothetical protein